MHPAPGHYTVFAGNDDIISPPPRASPKGRGRIEGSGQALYRLSHEKKDPRLFRSGRISLNRHEM